MLACDLSWHGQHVAMLECHCSWQEQHFGVLICDSCCSRIVSDVSRDGLSTMNVGVPVYFASH